MWRTPGGGSFILKVDRQNGGSPDLVTGYEDIAPGHAIPPHRRLVADDIIFVHRGSGVVELGAHEGVRPGLHSEDHANHRAENRH